MNRWPSSCDLCSLSVLVQLDGYCNRARNPALLEKMEHERPIYSNDFESTAEDVISAYSSEMEHGVDAVLRTLVEKKQAAAAAAAARHRLQRSVAVVRAEQTPVRTVVTHAVAGAAAAGEVVSPATARLAATGQFASPTERRRAAVAAAADAAAAAQAEAERLEAATAAAVAAGKRRPRARAAGTRVSTALNMTRKAVQQTASVFSTPEPRAPVALHETPPTAVPPRASAAAAEASRSRSEEEEREAREARRQRVAQLMQHALDAAGELTPAPAEARVDGLPAVDQAAFLVRFGWGPADAVRCSCC